MSKGRTTLVVVCTLAVVIAAIASMLYRPSTPPQAAVCGVGQEDDYRLELQRIDGVLYVSCTPTSH